jgi:intraflagellar transport protein 122
MRTTVAWTDKVPERDSVKSCVYNLAFKPDGTQLVAAVGSRVLVYDAVDGDLLHSLKGHKKTLYCVAYAQDGKRFASGGEDKTIIIWTSKAEGILKYSHNDSIQCLAYNRVTQQLASGTAGDFGLWSPEQKSVAKHKVQSRILCMSWTNDGTTLTLGMYDGKISLRDKGGGEKQVIQRSAPVWSIEWNPSRDDSPSLLAVGCWDQTLSFYDATGHQHGRDRQLGHDPCCLKFFSNGEYLCVGGSDRKATLWTKEGVRLNTIAESEDWVWACTPRPNANFVAVGGNDGTITMHQLVFSTVHGLYRERYAFREYMTDVVVQNMVTEQKMRIKCRAYVKKIAIYKDRLAVQLPDRLYIYEISSDENMELRHHLLERLALDVECNLLVVTSNNFLMCIDKKLQLFTFASVRVREWVMESTIRYIKPVGGPAGREGLIVGCEDGTVVKVFIDNPFTVPLVKHKASVRSLDMSMERDKVAVVDEHSAVSVYDIATGSLLFEEQNAEAVAWNTEIADMLCFSAHGTLSIKTGSFPVHQQRMQGVVVGFKGSRIYALHYVALQAVDVPQSASLYRYLEKRDFAQAYKIACLGVTEPDWRQLAHEALKSLNLDVAKRAYTRLRDTKYIDLVGRIEAERRQAGHDDTVLIGTVLAYQGKFQEAAKLFCKANRVERAIDMFSDLRKWEEARQFAHTASAESAAELVRRQAAWAEESNDMSTAYQTYLAAGEHMKAIKIVGEKGWTDKLNEIAKTLDPKTQANELRACVTYLDKIAKEEKEAPPPSMSLGAAIKVGGFMSKLKKKAGIKLPEAAGFAKDILGKLGDVDGLLQQHLDYNQWDDALKLIEEHPALAPKVYLPYAQWLIGQDRFEEAQAAFKQAGMASKSLEMLRTLTHNAVLEHRYNDAGHYLWTLAKEMLATAPERPSSETLKEFDRCRRTAEQYYAYHSIHKYTDEPFTALTPDTVFNISRALLSQLLRDAAPYGVSKAYCLFALAKQAKALGANKLARVALERLQTFKVPLAWQEQVDLFALTIRARPTADAEELQPSCFRCQTINPLLNQAGDKCTACGHPFCRSFVNFELLPLVRFQPARDIAPVEAVALLRREPPPRKAKRPQAPANPWDQNGPDVQTLSLAGDAEAAEHSNMIDIDDPFTKAMLDFEYSGRFTPTVATREMLIQMDASEVFVVQWGTNARPTEYYRNMLPDVPVVLCHNCNHFFHEEDWEFSVMSKGVCPFCRVKADGVDAGSCLSFPPARAGAAPTGASMLIQ